jgi:hypothetical protein
MKANAAARPTRNEHHERAENHVSEQTEDESREPRKTVESQHHNVSGIRTDKSRHRQAQWKSVESMRHAAQRQAKHERKMAARARRAAEQQSKWARNKAVDSWQRNVDSANRVRETHSAKRRAVERELGSASVESRQSRQTSAVSREDRSSEIATQAGEVSEKWSERRSGEKQIQSSTVQRKTLQQATLRSGQGTRIAVQRQDSSFVRRQAAQMILISGDPPFKPCENVAHLTDGGMSTVEAPNFG